MSKEDAAEHREVQTLMSTMPTLECLHEQWCIVNSLVGHQITRYLEEQHKLNQWIPLKQVVQTVYRQPIQFDGRYLLALYKCCHKNFDLRVGTSSRRIEFVTFAPTELETLNRIQQSVLACLAQLGKWATISDVVDVINGVINIITQRPELPERGLPRVE